MTASVEGLFAEVIGACAGAAVLTGWALALGCSPFTVAMIGALPFLGQGIQLPAAWLATRFGRRTVCVTAVTIQSQAILPLALLPFLSLTPEQSRALLIAVAAVMAIAGVVVHNAWLAWMADLVPGSVRGRYFGGRNARATVVGSLGALAVGIAIDHMKARGAALLGLAALAVVASLAGLAATWLLLRTYDPTPADPDARLSVAPAAMPFRDASVRPFLRYQLAWNAAIGISTGLLALHMVSNLKLGFAVVAAHGVATAAVRVVCAPRWGRVIDRAGTEPVLIACCFGLAVTPLLWALPDGWWLFPLILDPLITGALGSGHALASFAMPLSLTSRKASSERPYYFAAFAMVGGLAYAFAAAGGGVVASRGIKAAFVLSALARLGAATLALRLDRRRIIVSHAAAAERST